MKPILNDPELMRLVAELNREESDTGGKVEASGEATPQLRAVVTEAVRLGASDVLLVAGSPPVVRLAGALRRLGSDVLGTDEVEAMFSPLLDGSARKALGAGIPLDFSVAIGEGEGRHRFRINLHRQRGSTAATMRLIRREIPTLAELNLPPEVGRVVDPVRGLVLVCGPTGSGKTSTIAALIGQINRSRSVHIVTLEDPIEYEHTSEAALIEQVEIGTDAAGFQVGLRAALRQDPDVIVIGEIRDAETAATALSAAETGHLILATLHTSDTVQSIHRLIDLFPPSQHAQVQQQLSFALHAVLCQQLVSNDGKMLPIVELMLMNGAVRNHIRTGRLQNLYNELVLGRKSGMVTFESSLARLVKEGKLPEAEARRRASHLEELDSLLRL
jgi:twitching motility protein PilT